MGHPPPGGAPWRSRGQAFLDSRRRPGPQPEAYGISPSRGGGSYRSWYRPVPYSVLRAGGLGGPSSKVFSGGRGLPMGAHQFRDGTQPRMGARMGRQPSIFRQRWLDGIRVVKLAPNTCVRIFELRGYEVDLIRAWYPQRDKQPGSMRSLAVCLPAPVKWIAGSGRGKFHQKKLALCIRNNQDDNSAYCWLPRFRRWHLGSLAARP